MKKKEYLDYIEKNPECACVITDKGTVTKASIKLAIREERSNIGISELYAADYCDLVKAEGYLVKISEYSALIKELDKALDEKIKAKYAELTDEEIKELLVNRKWYYTIFDGIKALYVTTSHNMANRVSELADRYESTLPELESEVSDYEAKAKSHLERMGFVW